MTIIKLIGGCTDSVLTDAIKRLGLNSIGHATISNGGRLETFAVSNENYSADGYFIDRDGVEHPLKIQSHAFPNGQIMSVYVPEDQ